MTHDFRFLSTIRTSVWSIDHGQQYDQHGSRRPSHRQSRDRGLFDLLVWCGCIRQRRDDLLEPIWYPCTAAQLPRYGTCLRMIAKSLEKSL